MSKFLNRLTIPMCSIASIATIASLAVAPSAFAHDSNNNDGSKTNTIARYYESLPANKGAPANFDKEWARTQILKGGGNEEDVKFLLTQAESDICNTEEVKPLCAYAGATTIHKVRNLAYKLKRAGAKDSDVMDAIAPIMEYGITMNLEKLYGEKGLSDDDWAKIARKKGIRANRNLQERGERRVPGQPLKLEQRNKANLKGIGDRLRCLGLNTDMDEQTITSTNPIYGRRYRLVTCSAGFNIRRSWSLWWWDFSIQGGGVFTHARFARRVLGVYHLTGAQDHICSGANALGNAVTNCNNNNWSAPPATRIRVLWNQPAGVVVASGHAHKLGHNFNTSRNY